MVTEVITLEGHIIDSNLLARVLDEILAAGGEFEILEIHIGRSRDDRSHALIELRTESVEGMQKVLARVGRCGAIWLESGDVEIRPADGDGAFPPDFYVTTDQQTFVRYQGEWLEVRGQEMDCGLVLNPADRSFRCVPITKVRRGDPVVCGQRGIKVVPADRHRAKGLFGLISADISADKPMYAVIRSCASLLSQVRSSGKKVLLAGGPAIVHSGGSADVVRLIERGYVQVLFAGNALAAHDIEFSLYGTSMGVYVEKGTSADTGRDNHLRAINEVRRAGGIAQAVAQGVLTGGILHACVRHGVPYILAGSVRDDGPLPDTMINTLAARDALRASIVDVGFALLLATGVHSIAAVHLLPAWVPAVCVDLSPTVLSKVAERGSFQTIGLPTDVEAFLRTLVEALDELEPAAQHPASEGPRLTSGATGPR